MSFVLSGLTFRYPEGTEDVLVDLTVTIAGGQTVALLGPSGSGKTTLLNLLGLLWDQSVGEKKIVYRRKEGDEDYHRLGRRRRAQLRREEFGFVLQTCYLLPHFSALQNVGMPLALQGRPRRGDDGWEAAVRALVEAAGDPELAKVIDNRGGEISLGQKQRFAVLRAVVHNPRVVFADEPTSNLDPDNTEKMLELLGRWRAGDLSAGGQDGLPRTLFLVCHHLETARRHADWVVLLNKQHRLAASFARSDWEKHAHLVHAVLGTPAAAPLPGPKVTSP